VQFAAIVCYPTPQANNDPDYVLPTSGEVVPHMQPIGRPPKLISVDEYTQTLGYVLDPAPSGPQRLPFIVYSHGLGGSPISSGYLQVMAALASNGYMVGGVFHGDARFSPIRVENVADAIVFLAGYNLFVNMELMRPLSLIAMTDKLLADPNYSAGINRDQIGGFGASMGGEAMLHLLGADITMNVGLFCHSAPRDTRIKAAVGYVPYAGQTFLPAFCDSQSGVDSIDTPFLALSGTADTTAPIKMMDSALRRMKGSRYLVELTGVPHEFKPSTPAT
jgi:predicted dienelactone hydrolase